MSRVIGAGHSAGSRLLRVARSAHPVVALLGLATAAACGGEETAAEEAPKQVNVGVENVAVVMRDQIESGPVISGSLKARSEASVRAEIGGTVVQVYAERGQAVSRGAVLARLEGATAEQAQLSAQAAVRSAERNYEVAQREQERTATLVQAGALATRDLEGARNAVSSAQAQLAGARAQLAAAAKQVANTVVRSPISGVVSDRPVNAGDVVSPGTALFTVVDPRTMQLEANLSSDQLSEVRIGAPVTFTVSGYPGRSFTGRIERISPAADPLTRQVPVFISIPNAGGALVSGLFAEGRVTASTRQALVVPFAAVDQTGVSPTVLRVKGGVTERVPVQLGLSDPETERVELVSGVVAGDTVLTGAATGVSVRTPVRITAAPPR
ncbi:MAG: efflux RND transporter periplasmic adaptor subunit [Gemmatimonadetes bacterium]|nr:efflux RND transporter periplasmic adaptor subunit [Gemmatimonadota bacterium]